MKPKNIKILSLIFFINILSIFNLILSMEYNNKQEFKNTSIKSINKETIDSNITNMPSEVKLEILNHLVGKIINENQNLDPIAIIKVVAKNILQLKQLNTEFNELTKYFIKYDLNKIFKNYDININKVQPSGQTILMEQLNDEKFTQFLIDVGVNIEVKNISGFTPLILAAASGYTNIVKLLIDNKFNIDEKTKCGHTALMWAAGKKHKDIVKLLINSNVNINAADMNNDTALIWASKEANNKKIIKLLIKAGADVSHEGRYGYTALRWAERYRYEEVVDLLNK